MSYADDVAAKRAAIGQSGGPIVYGSPGVASSPGAATYPNLMSAGAGSTGSFDLGTGAPVGQPSFMNMGASSLTPPGTVMSQTGTGGGGNPQLQALLQQLMGQAQGGMNSQLAQYKNLMASIMGPKGFLSQLGKTGEQRIATNEANQKGAAEQDAVSRGIGNTTIRSNLLGGVSRDAEQARQSLGESVAGQKAATSMQLFNMNPQPGMDTYLRLLTQLGSVAGSPSVGANGGGVTSFGR